jgi:hypothetical protein
VVYTNRAELTDTAENLLVATRLFGASCIQIWQEYWQWFGKCLKFLHLGFFCSLSLSLAPVQQCTWHKIFYAITDISTVHFSSLIIILTKFYFIN